MPRVWDKRKEIIVELRCSSIAQEGKGTVEQCVSRISKKYRKRGEWEFMSKKNGSKRIVINYYDLNDQIIKNNYLLLLIIDLIDNMGNKKVFTKIDLR